MSDYLQCCRVGARSASAHAQLHYPSRADLEPLVTRRSASFMLSSPAMLAGRMSPVLALGSQLVQCDATSQPQQHEQQEQVASNKGRGAGDRFSKQLPIPGQHDVSSPVKTNSFESGSFLSLSPTMQWLQVSRSMMSSRLDIHLMQTAGGGLHT